MDDVDADADPDTDSNAAEQEIARIRTAGVTEFESQDAVDRAKKFDPAAEFAN